MNPEPNKPDLLLLMMQQPQEYTSEEWLEILADDECRELYMLMSMTRSAICAALAEDETTDEVIDAEWQRLNARNGFRLPLFNSQSRKIASFFVGILMLSGIAVAAIQMLDLTQTDTPKGRESDYIQVSDTIRHTHQPSDSEEEAKPVTFDNIPFDKMLTEMAEYYHAEVVFQNEDASQLRLYFVWYKDQPLDKVVETLNHFESVNIIMDDKKLIVR